MFIKLRWWQLLYYAFWPPAKRRWEARLKRGIEWTARNPHAAIVFHEFDWFPDERLIGVHGPDCSCAFCESWRP